MAKERGATHFAVECEIPILTVWIFICLKEMVCKVLVRGKEASCGASRGCETEVVMSTCMSCRRNALGL